jgi:hypothetical protein
MKQSKKLNELGFSNNSEMMTLFEMRNLITKALSFYCGKYKKRFNFEVIGTGIGFGQSHITFRYDNRDYHIELNYWSVEKFRPDWREVEKESESKENYTHPVDEMIKEADWNNEKLVTDAVRKVKKEIN